MKEGIGLDKKMYRKIQASSFLSFTMDAYSLLLIGSLGAFALKVLLPPNFPAIYDTVLTYLTLGITVLFRPVGAMIFGNRSDKFGRKGVMIITVIGYSVTMLLTALVPAYAVAGYVGLILFFGFRLAQGIFVGGDPTGTHPMALETTSSKKRGLISGFIQSGFSVGSLSAALVLLATTTYFQVPFLYTTGWRIAAAVGIIPAFIALYIRISIPESHMFNKAKEKAQLLKNPLKTLMTKHWRIFIPAIITTIGMDWIFYSTQGFYATYLYTVVHFSPVVGAIILVYAGVAEVIGTFVGGPLAGRIGRKRFIALIGVIIAAISYPLYFYAESGSYISVLLFTTVLGGVGQMYWGAMPIFLGERYPTNVRGVGIAFSWHFAFFIDSWIGLIIPFFAFRFFSGTVAGYALTSSIFVIIGAIIMISGVALSVGETREMKLPEELQMTKGEEIAEMPEVE